MNGVAFSQQAQRDLEDIVQYILNDSGPAPAQHVFDDILAAIGMLVRHPNSGHRRDELRDQTLRVWRVHSFLIVYWPDEVPLAVSRVLHGHRDLRLQPTPRPE